MLCSSIFASFSEIKLGFSFINFIVTQAKQQVSKFSKVANAASILDPHTVTP